MLNLKVNGKAGKFTLNLPTMFNEVSNEYLDNAVKHISVAPDYSLVALVYREKLAVILNSAKQNKEMNTSVVPVFIKAGTTDSKFIKSIKLGNKVIVTGSDLSIGVHVNSPSNALSISNVVAICEGDNNVYREAMTITEYCHFVEFKLVPNSAIKGIISPADFRMIDPYISSENTNKA